MSPENETRAEPGAPGSHAPTTGADAAAQGAQAEQSAQRSHAPTTGEDAAAQGGQAGQDAAGQGGQVIAEQGAPAEQGGPANHDSAESLAPRERSPGARMSARAYWRANLKLTTLLLAAWFTSSYLLGILLVEPLNAFRIGGFPLGFWFAQQGSIYTFILLIVIYAIAMDRLARRFGAEAT